MTVNPLENFYNMGSQIPPIEKNMVSHTIEDLNRNAFKNTIPSLPEMDEYSIISLIKNNIDIITDDILREDKSYVPILRSPKFIDAFTKAVNTIPINHTTVVACNKITYDYFTSDNPEQSIKQQYLALSKIINRPTINKLMTIGLDETISTNLALCRYSSINEKTNIKRLNFAMYHRDPNIMTDQMVIWIYEKLFDRISDLFQATMFEVYSPQQQEDFGENFMEVYGTVGLAVLIILNNMTSENILKVLAGYAEEWECMGKPQVRFSLHALSGDYSRISRSVDYLSSIGTIVP